jgi:hypothetical protein
MKAKLFTLYLGLFFLLSCVSKNKYEQIQESMKKLENIKTDFSEEEWYQLELEIEILKTELQTNRRNYSDEEIENINKLIGNYYAIKLTHEAKTITRDFLDASQQLEGIFETYSKFYTDTVK